MAAILHSVIMRPPGERSGSIMQRYVNIALGRFLCIGFPVGVALWLFGGAIERYAQISARGIFECREWPLRRYARTGNVPQVRWRIKSCIGRWERKDKKDRASREARTAWTFCAGD